MNTGCSALIALLLALGSTYLGAHEVRPGYLQITADRADELPRRYHLLWKRPVRETATGARALDLRLVLPTDCTSTPGVLERHPGVLIERFSLSCPRPLQGQRIAVIGLQQTLTDVFVRLADSNGRHSSLRLTAEHPAGTLASAPPATTEYLWLGTEHLLLGFDHILFLLGLVLLVQRWRTLILVLTAFTLAHSLSLALAVLQVLHLPSAPVEAGIALSILYIAAELTRPVTRRSPLAQHYPQALALGFGLVHGLGFAGALQAIGLPQHQTLLALLLFNTGLELGQLAIVAALLLAWRITAPLQPRLRPLAALPTWGLGTAAAYWLLSRVFAILSVP